MQTSRPLRHGRYRERSRWFRWGIPLLLAAGFLLFFAGGPVAHAPRSVRHVLNLGHIAFFALFSLYISRWFRNEGSFAVQAAVLLGLVAAFGSGIEVLQLHMSRDFDLDDIARNIIGCLVCLFFFLPSRRSLEGRTRLCGQVLTGLLLAAQLVPVITAAADEIIARRSFPVLASFETPFEKSRWTGNARFAVESGNAFSGRAALRVDLGTDDYSGAHLTYFPGNWAGWSVLEFSVFNPSHIPIDLTCRIHDRQHLQGPRVYEDRFNRTFRLRSGWTAIAIPLSEVESAPADRGMDLGHIDGIGIFAAGLSGSRTILIDAVRLRRQ